MRHIAIRYNFLAPFCLFMLCLVACSKDDTPTLEEPGIVNSLVMQLNGKSWQPTVIDGDKCRSRLVGAWSSLTRNGVTSRAFTISANSDSDQSSAQARSMLEIQIVGVNKKGIYHTTGTYRDTFDSYAFYRIDKSDGTYTRYVNTQSSFAVEVDEPTQMSYTLFSSIKGSFRGTLYNELNPQDSVLIEKGSFNFGSPNNYDFSQCAP